MGTRAQARPHDGPTQSGDTPSSKEGRPEHPRETEETPGVQSIRTGSVTRGLEDPELSEQQAGGSSPGPGLAGTHLLPWERRLGHGVQPAS